MRFSWFLVHGSLWRSLLRRAVRAVQLDWQLKCQLLLLWRATAGASSFKHAFNQQCTLSSRTTTAPSKCAHAPKTSTPTSSPQTLCMLWRRTCTLDPPAHCTCLLTTPCIASGAKETCQDPKQSKALNNTHLSQWSLHRRHVAAPLIHYGHQHAQNGSVVKGCLHIGCSRVFRSAGAPHSCNIVSQGVVGLIRQCREVVHTPVSMSLITEGLAC